MEQSSPAKPKNNLKWLLIALGAVIVAAALYYYFGIYRVAGSKITNAISPSVSNSPTAVTSQASTRNQTNDNVAASPTPVTSPISSDPPDTNLPDKTYSGDIYMQCDSRGRIAPASFDYPGNGTYVRGQITAGENQGVYYNNGEIPYAILDMEDPFWAPSQYCATWNNDLNKIYDWYTLSPNGGGRSEISSGPTTLTINGKSALTWTEHAAAYDNGQTGRYHQSGPETWMKFTAIASGNRSFIVIISPSYTADYDLSGYNKIVNNFKFL